jgi:type IV secretion system protein TrbL
MSDLGIIDRFLQTFIRYIDGGFGLLNGDVVALTSILIGIDVTLAGLFWALDRNGDVVARLIRKTLYVGSFAFIIGNFQTLSTAIFNSFAALGIQATGAGLGARDLLLPGKLAGTGFQAAWPLLQQAGSLIGVTTFFAHFVTIAVLLLSWTVVIFAFFILAVQLFITVLEFKLTSLAGFVLVPFALWNRSAFLAERVLGNVISSGIKLMVLAVIVGIGSTLFSSFTSAAQGQDPSLAGAMSLVLAAITFFGLGIYGPAISAGLVSGAPQLGAGAAIGTAAGLAGAAMLTGGAAMGGVGILGAAGAGGLAAIRAGTAMGSAASTAYGIGQGTSGSTGAVGGAAGGEGMARAGVEAATQPARSAFGRAKSSLSETIRAGRQAAWTATGARTEAAADPSRRDGVTEDKSSRAPEWARRLRAEQRARHTGQLAAQAVKEGDRPGAPANPQLDREED